MNFLETYNLAITSLSPIHIGCGEDFEPTNYIIDAEKKRLYGFDPSKTLLPEGLANKLTELAENANLLGIQRFFRENQAVFVPYSYVLIPVADGVASDYHNKIGKVVNVEGSGKQVFNQFSIERHVHSCNTPYIPGSGLKGALRTALMDRLNDKKPVAAQLEKKNSGKLAERLLGGDFATSPLRLLKVADCMPTGAIESQVLYAVNRYKLRKYDRKTGQEKAPRGVVARKESILPGQYRALAGALTIHDLGNKGVSDPSQNKPNVPVKNLRPELVQIAKDCNAYHLPRLHEELHDMEISGMIDPIWKTDMEKLLDGELRPLLDAGHAMLVRVGKYGGAESKTLSGVAEIKIMMGKVDGKQQFDFLNKTKTFWFSAPSAEAQKNLLPFGWALVEIDPQGELPQLKYWCEQQAQNRPDMKAEYKQLASIRLEAEQAVLKLRIQKQAAVQAEQERKEELRRHEEEVQNFPWRTYLPDLNAAANWGDLLQIVAKIDEWKKEVEVSLALSKAAERVQSNYPKTWSSERDLQVADWLAPAGVVWPMQQPAQVAPLQKNLSAEEQQRVDRILGLKDWGQFKDTKLQISALSLPEAEALKQVFCRPELGLNKNPKNEEKKKAWKTLEAHLRKMK